MNRQNNNRSNPNPEPSIEDRVNGFSVVFSLHRPEKQHSGNKRNKLKAYTIRNRIQLSSLNTRRIFFVENNNLHSLPSHCTGVLVAYSPCGKRIMREKDVTDHHEWFLGTIVFHSYEVTSIAPTEVSYEFYNDESQSWSIEDNISYNVNAEGAIISFKHGEFQLRYLNAVRPQQNQGYGFIQASLPGPDDTLPRSIEMKKKCRKYDLP
jgi:hypothetical protein